MAKVNAALRAKLMGQKEGMKSGGFILKRKDWTKGKLRLTPMGDELPGAELITFYSSQLKKGSTSPATYGIDCPIIDYFNNLKATGSKEDKEFAYDFCNINREYWVPCILRGEEQTVANPNLHIFPLTSSPYKLILDWLTDEDIGEDITDADEGRDILLKKIVGDRTEYKADKLDRTPIHDDPAVAQAIVEAAEVLDIKSKFFDIDWDNIEEIYSGLTGEEVPSHYKEAWDDYVDAKKSAAKGAKASRPKTSSAKANKPAAEPEETSSDEPEETPADEPADSGDTDMVGKRVKWTDTDDDTDYEGVVVGVDDDEGYEGNLLIQVEGEDDPWSMPEGDVEEVPEAKPAVKKGGKKKPGASGGIKGKMR